MTELVRTSTKNKLLVMMIALLSLFIPLAYIIASVIRHTGGVFSYPVDDAFIHMQLAENLSQHGNWGINSHEFGSASSSILYTLVLSGLFSIFPSHQYIPLAVNAVAAIILLFCIRRWLEKQQLSTASQIFLLLLVVILGPLPTLVLSGMEHTVQALFSFLFLTGFCDWLSGGNDRIEKAKLPLAVILFALLTVTIRYEGLFLVGMACLLLLWRRRFSLAFQLIVLASLPIIIFGIYSVSEGSYFLPNSVLVKSEAAQFSIAGLARSLGNIIIQKLTFSEAGVTLLATQKLLLLLPLVYLVFRNELRLFPKFRYLLLILTGTTLLHLLLADTGKFYRYEAYLIISSVVVVGTIGIKYLRKVQMDHSYMGFALALLIISLLLFPVILRSLAAFSKAKQACINIYEQQYQMGKFLQQYFPDETIAANDIGAVSYFTRGEVVDLWGLATIEIARSKKGGYWTAPFLDSFTRKKNTGIAVIYDSWIGKSIPSTWEKIGSWRIFNNVVCGDDVVNFYAVDSLKASKLKNSLLEYEPKLPPDVAVQYYY